MKGLIEFENNFKSMWKTAKEIEEVRKDKFSQKIQRPKMKELWNNQKDKNVKK